MICFISGRNLKSPQKTNKESALKKFLVSYDVFAIFISIEKIACEAINVDITWI